MSKPDTTAATPADPPPAADRAAVDTLAAGPEWADEMARGDPLFESYKAGAEMVARAYLAGGPRLAALEAALRSVPLPSSNGSLDGFYQRFYDWYNGAARAALSLGAAGSERSR